ncbi:MAG: hypothetical protein LBK95_19830, partial [Bifidobacteriaceae bacterium]|nr:hypothetical protein [Bifidobacteriaceae bacterium]
MTARTVQPARIVRVARAVATLLVALLLLGVAQPSLAEDCDGDGLDDDTGLPISDAGSTPSSPATQPTPEVPAPAPTKAASTPSTKTPQAAGG